MRKKILFIVGMFLVVNLTIGAATKKTSLRMTGWISDEFCGAAHAKPGGEDCVRKCLKGGAHIGHPEWRPQRMVFVADKGKRIWVVANPEALKGQEGRHVKITGQVDTSKKTIYITKVKALREESNRN